MAETIRQKNVVIRKQHSCIACWRQFQPGTKMRYWFGRVMGDLNSCYTCPTCDSILRLRGEYEYEEGHVYELCNDYKFDTPEDYLSTLQQ